MKKISLIVVALLVVLPACDGNEPNEGQEHRAELEEEAEIPDRHVELVEEEPTPAERAPAEGVRNTTHLSQFGAESSEDGSIVDTLAEGDEKTAKNSGTTAKMAVGGSAKSGAGSGLPAIEKGSIEVRGTGKGGGGTGVGYGHAYGRGANGVGSATIRKNVELGNRRKVRERRRNTEQYTDYGLNKFVDVSEDALSTFAADVDTGSYTIARRKLNDGAMPPTAGVRVEEFVNYFDYDYAPPKADDVPFAVHLEAAPSPFSTDGKRYLLRIGVQGKKFAAKDRKPVHLTFLVDVSGSMNRPDKIELAKRSLKYLTKNLREGDTVAIATYASGSEVVLEPTGVEKRGTIYDAIDDLKAGGSTAMSDGLGLAYRLAVSEFHTGHENRVVVLSDGDANVGPASHQEILKKIEKYVKKGVTLSTVGFGMGNYRDTLMEQLADNGNGNYQYVDSFAEAKKIFGEQLDGTLQVIAKDVKLQVEFDSGAVRRYRLIGYENRDVADEDFRDDEVDAGEIGAGHTVTAMYELELTGQRESEETLATVRVRHKKPRGRKAQEQAFPLKKSQLQSKVSSSSKDFQFAAAVCAFAEKLRKSPYADKLSYGWIEEVAASGAKDRSDRKELVDLIRKARKLDV